MASIREDLRHEFKLSDTTMRIVLVCTAVLLLVNLGLLLLSDDGLAMAAHYNLYLSASSDGWYMLNHPWTLITHMFTHVDFWHWLWNMVGLIFSGRLFHHFLGNRKMLTTYLLGGLAGFALFFIAFNLLPIIDGEATVIGASGAIMAVFIAIAAYAPNYEVGLFGGSWRIQIKYLAAVYVIADFVSIRYFENTGGHLAHLGGALYGFVLARYLREGKDIQAWAEKWIGRWFFGERPVRMKVVKTQRPRTDEDFNAEKLRNQKRVDSILDKISRGGYDSLTREEKEFLFKYSQK